MEISIFYMNISVFLKKKLQMERYFFQAAHGLCLASYVKKSSLKLGYVCKLYEIWSLTVTWKIVKFARDFA